MATVPYLFRVFYSLSMYSAPAKIGICIPVAYGVVAWFGLPRLGLVALACAFAAVWWCAFAVCLVGLARSVRAMQVVQA
jgi:peptidoglycan biosynthesis protein MviN/MurJ (putative lipid II flippase)